MWLAFAEAAVPYAIIGALATIGAFRVLEVAIAGLVRLRNAADRRHAEAVPRAVSASESLPSRAEMLAEHARLQAFRTCHDRRCRGFCKHPCHDLNCTQHHAR